MTDLTTLMPDDLIKLRDYTRAVIADKDAPRIVRQLAQDELKRIEARIEDLKAVRS